MIPPFVRIAEGVPRVLPPGIHWASLAEVEARFALNARRRWLFEGVAMVATALRAAGCRIMYLNGSYVTEKEQPEDFDGCWNARGVSAAMLDPVLLDFADGRAAQKRKFRGEMFIVTPRDRAGRTMLSFFQIDKLTGRPKGIVGIRLLASRGRVP